MSPKLEAAPGLTGVILAGGRNSRMGGRSKALLSYQGVTFLERQLEEMSLVCRELLVITSDPLICEAAAASSCERLRCLPDLQPGAGPLAGLQAAMHEATCERLWVVGCDMPFISSAAAVALAKLGYRSDEDAAVPRLSGRDQPLHGVYHRRSLSVVERQLAAEDYRMMQLLAELRVVSPDEAFFGEQGIPCNFTRNVNDPEAYARLLAGE